MNQFRRLHTDMTVNSVVSLLIGVLLIFRPVAAMRVVMMIIGGVIAVNGLTDLLTSLSVYRSGDGLFGSGILSGMARLIVGGYLLLHPGSVLSAGTTIFGVYLLADGIIGLTSRENTGTSRVLHILLLIAGGFMLFRPFSVLNTAGTWVGIVVLADGILGLMSAKHISRFF